MCPWLDQPHSFLLLEYDTHGTVCGVRANTIVHCNRIKRRVIIRKSRDPSVLKELIDLQYGLELPEEYLEGENNLYIGLGQGTFVAFEDKYGEMGFKEKDLGVPSIEFSNGQERVF